MTQLEPNIKINDVEFSPEQIEITCYFAQWATNYAIHYGGGNWRYMDKKVTTQQLFEIYTEQLNGINRTL